MHTIEYMWLRLLFSSVQSMLFKRLREELGMVYSVVPTNNFMMISNTAPDMTVGFFMWFDSREKASEGINEVLELTDRVRASGLPDDVFLKSRSEMLRVFRTVSPAGPEALIDYYLATHPLLPVLPPETLSKVELRKEAVDGLAASIFASPPIIWCAGDFAGR